MDALVMCGGRGSRLDADREKPLVHVAGRPMVDRVTDALEGSGVETVFAVVSPQAPATAAHLDVPTVETPGEGYVEDLQAALDDERIDRPVLTVAADLPLIEAAVADDVLTASDGESLTAVVPVQRKTELGLSVDTTFEHAGRTVTPTGLNVVGEGGGDVSLLDDERLAVNVNRPRDLDVARRLAE